MDSPGAIRVARMRTLVNVIACDKREAFAQGSASDEATHSLFVA